MMERFVLKVDKVFTPLKEREKAGIVIEENKIKDIIPWNEIPKNEKIISFPEGMAFPGFLDIHIHGYAGFDIMSGEPEDLVEISKELPKHGVTSFLPTTETASQDTLLRICETNKNTLEKNNEGANIIGLHLEGPHISGGEEAGAQNVEFVRNPDVKELEKLVEASGRNIERVTIAPELPGALDYIERARELGITVSIGHTGATFEETLESFNFGASICSHLFNGMKSFHHRDPGPIGACLLDDEVFVELIPDLIHLHPAAIRMALRVKGLEKSIFVSDAVHTAGFSDGEYEIGGLKVVVEGGVARVKDTGRIAGSSLTLDQAVKNAVDKLDMKIEDAVRMVTLNPAKALGKPDRGLIKPGSVAEITVLNSELEVIATIVDGEVRYQSD